MGKATIEVYISREGKGLPHRTLKTTAAFKSRAELRVDKKSEKKV